MGKSKGGRPNVYDTRIKPNLNYIAMLRNNGVNHDDIAKVINVAPSTYYKHKKEIDEFSELIKNGDATMVEKVEASMYQLALGKAQSTKIEYRYDEEGKEIPIKKTIEFLPPDKVAQFFILTNRATDRWRHKQEISVSDVNDNLLPSFAEVLNAKRADVNEKD